ncbi:MAG: hypothetical protein ACRENS_14035 [Candidatus Eiseniibacteriota bacterium]
MSTAATARTVVRNQTERMMSAVLAGLKCWGLAVVSIFIPLGHFILVPAFLIAGPVVFLMKIAEDVSLKGAHGVCPMCGTEQEFTEQGRLLARHPVRCPGCGRQLELIAELPGLRGKPQSPVEKPQEVQVWVAADAQPAERNPPVDR